MVHNAAMVYLPMSNDAICVVRSMSIILQALVMLLVYYLAGDISSELYGDWLWDENFKFCLIFTHFSRFSPFSGYIWWNNTLSSLENFSLNSILVFLFLMSHPDNGGFLKIAQKRDSISKKTSFCIMVINTDHQESWFLSVGHPLCALR